MSWPIACLGDLVEIKGGGTPSRAKPDYWGGDIPWATVKDFKSGAILGTEEHITCSGLENSATNLIPMGTILIPSRMALGKVAIAGVDMAINQDLKALAIVFPERLDRDYLFWFLSSVSADFERAGKGATVKGITLDFVKAVQVPLPPLATQRHIAKVLEQADRLRRQAQQLESALQELRRSVFLSSVGPSAEGYGSWGVMEVSELAGAERNSMRTGPFGSALKHSEFVDSGVAVIGIDNAVSDRFQWKERRYITEEKYKGLKKYQVFPGDVIVTIMGTTGRSAVVPEDVPLAISTKHLATITLAPEKATPEFLKYAIQYHPLIAEQIAAQNKGAVMDGLNLGIIKKLKLPVPPLAIQQKLSRAMKALDAESETLAKSTENFEQLFNSLMQRAFNGELTPKLA